MVYVYSKNEVIEEMLPTVENIHNIKHVGTTTIDVHNEYLILNSPASNELGEKLLTTEREVEILIEHVRSFNGKYIKDDKKHKQQVLLSYTLLEECPQ